MHYDFLDKQRSGFFDPSFASTATAFGCLQKIASANPSKCPIVACRLARVTGWVGSAVAERHLKLLQPKNGGCCCITDPRDSRLQPTLAAYFSRTSGARAQNLLVPVRRHNSLASAAAPFASTGVMPSILTRGAPTSACRSPATYF